ncbi:MAG: gliding-motility protein MglA [Promethearchaeota archaeon]|nr:MAG: gliding-motility protein MglA [Candidatus Lokiarchaeota archaeon]
MNHIPSRGADGKIVFKIVYWGPSLGGKTTAVSWMFNKEGMAEGKMQSIVDPTGRTLFFDRTVMGVGGVKMQVYTVAGQRRHKFQRKTILNGVDGIIFVWDAQKEQWDENVWSMEELIEHLEGKLAKGVPLILMLNKMDLPNIISYNDLMEFLKEKGLDKVLNAHGIEMPVQVYETIAIEGQNIKRAFQQVCREAVLNYYMKLKK